MTLRLCLPERLRRLLVSASGAALVGLGATGAAPALVSDDPYHGHDDHEAHEAHETHDGHGAHGEDVVTVSATRSRRRVQDDPIRVEVIVWRGD